MLRKDLVPDEFIEALAAPFTLGAAKYGDESWRGLMATANAARDFARLRYASLLRHLNKYMGGEEYDPEGFHHLAAVAWNALIVLVALNGAGVANLYDPVQLAKAVDNYRKDDADEPSPNR